MEELELLKDDLFNVIYAHIEDNDELGESARRLLKVLNKEPV